MQHTLRNQALHLFFEAQHIRHKNAEEKQIFHHLGLFARNFTQVINPAKVRNMDQNFIKVLTQLRQQHRQGPGLVFLFQTKPTIGLIIFSRRHFYP